MSRAIHPLLTKVACDWIQANAPDAMPDSLRDLDAMATAGIDIETHRQALETVYAHGGPLAVARLPMVFRQAEGQPLVYVMLNSSSVSDLIDKEQRLERFWHSHHRLRVHELTESTLEFEHYAMSGRAPVRAESLFVFGARVLLLQEIGCLNLEATFPNSDAPQLLAVSDGELRNIPDGVLSSFRFEWSEFIAARRVLAGLDDLLIQQASPTDLSERTAAEEVATIIGQDLAHRWSLGEVAKLSARSTRSLQRALAAEGTTFSLVVDHVRVDEAQRMLADPAKSITEVGYCCGFSDAAHFSRKFKAATGLPPSEWRQQL